MPVRGADRVRLCWDVKLSLLNSADYPEYLDRKVRPGPALQALLTAGSGLVNPSILKVWTKFIKKSWRGICHETHVQNFRSIHFSRSYHIFCHVCYNLSSAPSILTCFIF